MTETPPEEPTTPTLSPCMGGRVRLTAAATRSGKRRTRMTPAWRSAASTTRPPLARAALGEKGDRAGADGAVGGGKEDGDQVDRRVDHAYAIRPDEANAVVVGDALRGTLQALLVGAILGETAAH